MKDLRSILAQLKRPRLLIRAARFGAEHYDRARDLARIIKAPANLSPAVALDALIAQEAQLELTRKSGDASYSVSRHVDVLIALMAEARLLPERKECA
ncbi:DUF6477 family protein [Aliiroseovarius sp. PTFE2010]|uniref:DUF6477 family protein n=1 Tax=Aliiroseovarius sp. PTFE2010 TaxID=3417190 RepID=UPI003CE93A6A